VADRPAAPSRLGIIAGGGELPGLLIQTCRRENRDFHVIALNDNADPTVIGEAPHDWFSVGQYTAVIARLREKGIERLVFCGKVNRPPLSALFADWRAALFLARIGGRLLSDNRLLVAIVSELESEGFTVVGPADVEPELLARRGAYGSMIPTDSDRRAIAIGLNAARQHGQNDEGQAVVVLGEDVIGREGPDGTDSLIARCAGRRAGDAGPILVKARKPQQDMRSDPPVIGLRTLQKAAAAGFRGIAVEPGGVLLMDGQALGRAADAAGMFLTGLDETP